MDVKRIIYDLSGETRLRSVHCRLYTFTVLRELHFTSNVITLPYLYLTKKHTTWAFMSVNSSRIPPNL
jgi:hypothetical protein